MTPLMPIKYIPYGARVVIGWMSKQDEKTYTVWSMQDLWWAGLQRDPWNCISKSMHFNLAVKNNELSTEFFRRKKQSFSPKILCRLSLVSLSQYDLFMIRLPSLCLFSQLFLHLGGFGLCWQSASCVVIRFPDKSTSRMVKCFQNKSTSRAEC